MAYSSVMVEEKELFRTQKGYVYVYTYFLYPIVGSECSRITGQTELNYFTRVIFYPHFSHYCFWGFWVGSWVRVLEVFEVRVFSSWGYRPVVWVLLGILGLRLFIYMYIPTTKWCYLVLDENVITASLEVLDGLLFYTNGYQRHTTSDKL